MTISSLLQSVSKQILRPAVICCTALLIIVSTFVWSLDHNDGPVPQPSQAAIEKFVVEITDTGYLPQTLEVPVGSTVEWVNRTNDPHRVAANPQPDHSSFPALDSLDPIGPGAMYSFTFSASGTYVYNNHYIQFDNNGEIRVSDAQVE